MSREVFEFLSARKTLHLLSLSACAGAAAFLCWARYRLHPSSFFEIPWVRLFMRFMNAPPAFSLSVLYALYFLTQFLTLIFMHAGLETTLWDFGFNDSVIWNTGHGQFLTIPVRGGQNALGEHFTPIFILLAPLYWLTDSVNALFLVQSLLLAACPPLVYGIAKRLNVSHLTALCLAFAAFFYQPMRNGILFPFQIQTFADPFLLFGFYALLCQAPKRALLAFLLALLCKENIVMEVFGIGLFMAAQKKKIGWVVCGLAAFVFLLNTKFIEPVFEFDYKWNKWGYYRHITHPTLAGWVDWAQNFFTLKTFRFLFLVFAPVLFLPFSARFWFLLLGPTLAVRLLTPFGGFRIIDAHYTAGLDALLFIASAYGLSRLSQTAYGRMGEPLKRLLGFPSVESLVRAALLLCALLFAGRPQLFRLEQALWEASNPDNQHIVQMLQKVPSSHSVVATETFLAQMTHRHFIFGFASMDPGAPLEKKFQNSDFLFVDRKRLLPNEKESWEKFQSRGYSLVYEYSFMSAWANPSLLKSPELEGLIQKWEAIENGPHLPYRKIVRRYYAKFILGVIIAFIAAQFFWGSPKKERAL